MAVVEQLAQLSIVKDIVGRDETRYTGLSFKTGNLCCEEGDMKCL